MLKQSKYYFSLPKISGKKSEDHLGNQVFIWDQNLLMYLEKLRCYLNICLCNRLFTQGLTSQT